MTFPSDSLSMSSAEFTVVNSDSTSSGMDKSTSAPHATNCLAFSGKSIVGSGQTGEFAQQLPSVNRQAHSSGQASAEARRLHQMYVSTAKTINEDELPDISSLSIPGEIISKSDSSEKRIKPDDNTSEATTLTAQAIAKDATPFIDQSIAVDKPDSAQLSANPGLPEKGRLLATIRTISEIQPVENADNLEVATVDGWKVVVVKSEFKAGQPVIYCEIDSILPVRDEFEFLRKSSHIVLPDGTEGFRLRTIKLRGQLSQGLLLPLDTLGNGVQVKPGDDVTATLGITKYEPMVVVPADDSIKGLSPHFVPKTDEERIQNLKAEFNVFKDKEFYVSEKLDGTSATFYLRNEAFGVCSRNYELKTDSGNTLCQVASKHSIEAKLRSLGRNIAIQAEVIGPKIQGNQYAINGNACYVFNIYDIDQQSYLKKYEMEKICKDLGLPTCPVVSDGKHLPATIDGVLAEADGQSEVNNKKKREGLVFVFDGNNPGERISFKAISNKYLLKANQPPKYSRPSRKADRK